MPAKLIKKTTTVEEFVDSVAPSERRARAEDTPDDALEEAMDDLRGAEEWEIVDEDEDQPPRRRRKK